MKAQLLVYGNFTKNQDQNAIYVTFICPKPLSAHNSVAPYSSSTYLGECGDLETAMNCALVNIVASITSAGFVRCSLQFDPLCSPLVVDVTSFYLGPRLLIIFELRSTLLNC